MHLSDFYSTTQGELTTRVFDSGGGVLGVVDTAVGSLQQPAVSRWIAFRRPAVGR
jgi:hypothetical protein